LTAPGVCPCKGFHQHTRNDQLACTEIFSSPNPPGRNAAAGCAGGSPLETRDELRKHGFATAGLATVPLVSAPLAPSGAERIDGKEAVCNNLSTRFGTRYCCRAALSLDVAVCCVARLLKVRYTERMYHAHSALHLPPTPWCKGTSNASNAVIITALAMHTANTATNKGFKTWSSSRHFLPAVEACTAAVSNAEHGKHPASLESLLIKA
jgi:hypothetical protein